MKPTDKQIAANRRNAAKSTGPVTPAGKAIAARNSLKHGLLAKEIVIDAGEGAESRDEFDAMLLDLKSHFEPQGPLEEILVEKIAVAYWRLRRAHRYEVGLIRQELDTATQGFYAKMARDGQKEHKTDEQIDGEIKQEQEGITWWQKDKNDLSRMRKDGASLESIYDRDPNWEALDETLEDDLADEVGYEGAAGPRELREFLSGKAGWSDDRIWQGLIEVCDEQAAQHRRQIEVLHKRKQDNKLALQVQKKIGCIPDAHDLDRLLKYEGSIEKQFYKAIDQLERLQRLRAGDNVPAPVAIDITTDRDPEK